MNDPDWAKLLIHVYQNEGQLFLIGPYNEDEGSFQSFYEEIREDIDFSEEISEESDLTVTLHQMHEFGLIDYELQEHGCRIELKEKGFDVAHDREMNRNQQRTNLGVGVLTAFLAVGSILQGYSAFLSIESFWNRLALTVVLVIMLVLGISVIGMMMGKDPNELANDIQQQLS